MFAFIILGICIIGLLIDQVLDYKYRSKIRKMDYTISDLIRKLAEANAEIDSYRNWREPLTGFLSHYNSLEEYLHMFGVKYDAYYGVPKYFSTITEYSYIINIYNDTGNMLFIVALPDVTKTNPEGLLHLYDFTTNAEISGEFDYRSIVKFVNKVLMTKKEK